MLQLLSCRVPRPLRTIWGTEIPYIPKYSILFIRRPDLGSRVSGALGAPCAQLSSQSSFHSFFSGCSEPSCPVQPSHPLRRPGGFEVQWGSMCQNLLIFSKDRIWKSDKRTISTMPWGVVKGVLRFGCMRPFESGMAHPP